jgi:D-alanine-D-alanine ligase
MAKAMTKAVVAGTGIRQAACAVFRREEADRAALLAAGERLGYPVFVKPARAGSSVGVSKAHDAAQLLAAAEKAFGEDEKILVEEAIVGSEVEVAVLEEKGIYTVSDCAEIVAGAEFYDYDAKYNSDASVTYVPARLPETVRRAVSGCAERIFRAIGCRGLSRVDFFVTPEGEIVFNEINTMPGFTSISMYPKLMIHAGLTYAELIDRLAAAAM